jgi:hypothetical protein
MPVGEEDMKMMIAWLGITAALVAGHAHAQTAGPLPQFQVDPFWPKLAWIARMRWVGLDLSAAG